MTFSTSVETIVASPKNSPQLWRWLPNHNEVFHKCGDMQISELSASTLVESSKNMKMEVPHYIGACNFSFLWKRMHRDSSITLFGSFPQLWKHSRQQNEVLHSCGANGFVKQLKSTVVEMAALMHSLVGG
jgi:hypothetical protein